MDCGPDGSATSRSCASSSSEALSSSEVSSASASAASTPGVSPRNLGARPTMPALALKRAGVPALALGGGLAALPRGDGPGDAPGTARQAAAAAPAPPLASARGRPSPVPALALPKPADAAAPASARAPAAPAPPPPAAPAPAASSAAALLSLDMLSPAFAVEHHQPGGSSNSGAAGSLAATCASRFGVAPNRLRFYALTEVADPQQLPPGCARVAVEVLDSRFSLSEMERLLSENQQLAAAVTAAQQQQQQQRQQQQQALNADVPASSDGVQLPPQEPQLQVELRQKILENEALRHELRRAKNRQRKAQAALVDINKEFMGLAMELTMQSSGSGHLALPGGKPLQLLAPGRGADEPVGTPAAVDDGRLF